MTENDSVSAKEIAVISPYPRGCGLRTPSRIRGFTLIELMITVAVIGILATIAYPSYIAQIQKTRRADAQTALLNTAQRLERCFTEFNTYAFNAAACNVVTPVISADGHYSVAAGVRTATTYTLTATPVAGDPQNGDTKCASFSITQANSKTATGSASGTCWQK